jgi:hypothetical protein
VLVLADLKGMSAVEEAQNFTKDNVRLKPRPSDLVGRIGTVVGGRVVTETSTRAADHG